MSVVDSTASLTLVSGRDDADTSILWVIGPLDDLTADMFETECKRMASRSRLLIIELSSCSFLSSAGLRALVHLQRRHPGAIALVTGDAQFEMLLRIAGLEQQLPRFTNVSEALAAAAAPELWATGSPKAEHATGGSLSSAATGFRRALRIDRDGTLDGVSNHAA